VGQGWDKATQGRSWRDLPGDARDQLGRVIARFEAEWERGVVPRVDDYLSDASAGAHRVALLAGLLRADLEHRLGSGRPVRVGDYLERYPELEAEAAADLVIRDFDLRRQGGATVSPDDYLAQFPWLGPELARRFSTTCPRGSAAGQATTRRQSRPPAASPQPSPVPGFRLPGKFEVLEKLGEGGMGEVWRVRRRDLGIDRAVKVIRPSFALNSETRARMLREAQAMAQIAHAHAVTVHDVGSEPVPYIEMEFVPGRTLDKLLKPGAPMPLDWTARVLDQLCDVIQVAHDHGIVHRDLKPSNLMLVDGRPPGKEFLKVLDFGIAKFLDCGPESLTINGQTLGTVMYMSPEQVENSSTVGAGSDIYTIGVILFELLTGSRPFTSRIPQIYYEIVHTPAPRFVDRNPGLKVPRGVDDLVLRCLSKDPRQRPPAARALPDEFRRLALPPPPAPAPAPDEPPEGPRPSRRLVLAATVPLLGLVGYALYQALRPEPFTLEPAEPDLEVTAGATGEVSILVGPEHLAEQVDVSPDYPPTPTIKVVKDETKTVSKMRRFLVETTLDAEPGTRTLAFRGSYGRSAQAASVSLVIRPPRVVPLPRDWQRAREGGELVKAGNRVYPRTIERVLPDGTRVTALLIRPSHPHPKEPEPFYIMKDKVWVGLFEAFERENPGLDPSPRRPAGGDPRLPVRNVSGYTAQAFAEWLGGKGHGFLPTGDQWDQAAGMNLKDRRGGPFKETWEPNEPEVAAEVKAFGEPLPVPGIAVGNLKGPLPVGLAARDVSPFGCRDMSGNGREWTRRERDGSVIVPLRAERFSAPQPYTFDKKNRVDFPFDESDEEISFRVVIELDPED
jgi:serine/threonine-protein kinase